ncbi:MAG: folate-binding protein [Alphaproteobacteria bacterium]|nr:folate-binding protein [Alphaproteobacteria bacterium]
MDVTRICLLPERGVIEVGGPEADAFLQGLLTNDMDRADPAHVVYAALLTPQGKYLFDFFVLRRGDTCLLDCEVARLAELSKRLNFYRLRAKVTVRDASPDFRVAAAIGQEGLERLALPSIAGSAKIINDAIAYTDPRHAAMGARLLLPHDNMGAYEITSPDGYHQLRISLGIAEGAADIAIEKYFLLEANFEELNGVDFKKGCYVGQELVSRMKHRNAVRKRILPVRIEGPCPPAGTAILAGGREVGRLHSIYGENALAYLRLSALAPDAPALQCGAAKLAPRVPDWLTLSLPETEDEQD